MDQVREIVGLVGGVLGPDVVGAYLHGSSVLGGLRPASDVDVLVVSRRRMDERERRALLGGLLGISGSRNKVRPVELTVVVPVGGPAVAIPSDRRLPVRRVAARRV